MKMKRLEVNHKMKIMFLLLDLSKQFLKEKPIIVIVLVNLIIVLILIIAITLKMCYQVMNRIKKMICFLRHHREVGMIDIKELKLKDHK